jgi:hypothetical protein
MKADASTLAVADNTSGLQERIEELSRQVASLSAPQTHFCSFENEILVFQRIMPPFFYTLKLEKVHCP